jgi:aldose 1-epimerase
MTTGIDREAFGRMPDGTTVERITLRGAAGFAAAIIPYGAVLQSLHVPDRAGRSEDIVLGHDTFDEYLQPHRRRAFRAGRQAGSARRQQRSEHAPRRP